MQHSLAAMLRALRLTTASALVVALAGCSSDTPPPLPTDARYDRSSADGRTLDARQDQTIPVTPKMLPIKAGVFFMGSPTTEPCRGTNETRHQVTLTHNFEIQSTEVTQSQFVAALGYQPFSSCGPPCPVMNVSWHEAAAYTNAVSAKAGLGLCYSCTGSQSGVVCTVAAAYTTAAKTIYDCPGYRLPTEAEWEFSYRSGTATALYDGPLAGCTANDVNADRIAWYNEKDAHPVGQKQANAWGMLDMAGNAYEWVNDYYVEDLGAVAAVDPVGGVQDACRTVRGGSWQDSVGKLRAASRSSDQPQQSYADYGFRVARTLP
jgi:formylglycine-generating enzyme required for sulfatase activity